MSSGTVLLPVSWSKRQKRRNFLTNLRQGLEHTTHVLFLPTFRAKSQKLISGRTPKRTYSPKGRIAGPLLRTLLRTLPQNPSQNLLRPFLERCVAVRPLRRAPNTFGKCNGFPPISWNFSHFQLINLSITFDHFQSLSVTFSDFESLPITFNHFQWLSITFTQSKTQESIDNRKVGETNS